MRRRRHEVRLREIRYWLNLLYMAYFHQINPRLPLEYLDYVEAISAETLQQAMQRYFNRENYIRVVLLPENYIK